MLHFGIIPGDTAGRIRTSCALKVLAQVAREFNFSYQLETYDLGADNYIETGELISDDQIKSLGATDGIFLGGFGDPRVDDSVCEQGIFARLCSELNLFVTVRCVRVFSPDLCPLKPKNGSEIELIVVRENTETSYSDTGVFIHKNTPDELALMQGVFIRKTVERVLRTAFELAHIRPRRTLALVDRHQRVLAHDIGRRVFAAIGREYPDVTTMTMSAEEAAGMMVCRPEQLDVIVTTADIGDMLMGMGQELQGGAGFGAMVYQNPGQIAMFVPCVDKYADSDALRHPNPIGAISALGQMLAVAGQRNAFMAIQDSISHVVSVHSRELTGCCVNAELVTNYILQTLETVSGY